MRALTGLSGLGGLIGGAAADVTAPTLDSATIDSSGVNWVFTLSETVVGHTGFTPTASGGAVTLSYLGGDGTSVLVFTGSRSIQFGETVTLDYAPGDVQDVPGNPLAAFSGVSVVNGSISGASNPKSQPRFGFAGQRYGSFAGKTEDAAGAPATARTQPRFGLTGRRYGSFGGR